jgi:hypothetical protein
MASSEVAFRKFLKWKKSDTILRVTFSPQDKKSSFETHLIASVFFVDEIEFTIALASEVRPHNSFLLDLTAATFTLAKDERSLDVLLANKDRWLFVEQAVS